MTKFTKKHSVYPNLLLKVGVAIVDNLIHIDLERIVYSKKQ